MCKTRFLYAALLWSGVAFADAPLDVTIRVLESPHELPDAVTKTIELPPRAAEATPENVPPGLDRANDARSQQPRQNGLDRATQARPQGRDLSPRGLDVGPRGRGQVPSVADEARNAGNRGNGLGKP